MGFNPDGTRDGKATETPRATAPTKESGSDDDTTKSAHNPGPIAKAANTSKGEKDENGENKDKDKDEGEDDATDPRQSSSDGKSPSTVGKKSALTGDWSTLKLSPREFLRVAKCSSFAKNANSNPNSNLLRPPVVRKNR